MLTGKAFVSHFANTNLDFTETLCYIIQREIDLVSHPDLNFEALAKDGILGKYTEI